jgi:hypothetical protein
MALSTLNFIRDVWNWDTIRSVLYDIKI